MANTLKDQEIDMLRKELEILMGEREDLLRIAGAAAVFVAELDIGDLPEDTYEAAEVLAESLNTLPVDALGEGLTLLKAEIVPPMREIPQPPGSLRLM
jgi:hypothetical protein